MINNFHSDFFDRFGMLRPYRTTEYGNPETLDAGNPFIHTAYLITLLVKELDNPSSRFNEDLVAEDVITIGSNYSEFYKNEIEDRKSISHDEMTGLCCVGVDFKIDYRRCWYRSELFLYWHRRGNLIGTILLPLLFVKMILTCAVKEKAKNTLPETDGPLQAWLICSRFNFTLIQKICSYFNKRNFGDNWLNEMFSIAFNRNEDHPCRVLTETK